MNFLEYSLFNNNNIIIKSKTYVILLEISYTDCAAQHINKKYDIGRQLKAYILNLINEYNINISEKIKPSNPT